MKIKNYTSVGLIAILLSGGCLPSSRADAGAVPSEKIQPSKKVLVVVSSENKITLKDGKIHSTGFFLSELMVPVRALHEAGYEFVIANPKGNPPAMDPVSDSAFWFGENSGASEEVRKAARADYVEIRTLCSKLGFCGAIGETQSPTSAKKLAAVIKDGLDSFTGIFFPGGHAPMEDLWKDSEVGVALKYFHGASKPTALICHGPIALLAALGSPEAYINAKVADQREAIQSASRGWIYNGYAMTVFTTREEQQEEPGQDNALGGYVRFYPDSALEGAGAYLKRADKWQNNVVLDRELITGQNPFSDKELAKAFLKALDAR